MGLTVRDVMQAALRTVHPSTRLADLEQDFASAGVSGFPVVEGTTLVGVVSRADVIRKSASERRAEQALSDYYHDETRVESDGDQVSATVGQHLADTPVSEVMAPVPVVVAPDASIDEAARLLIEHHIHRVPVVEDGHLRGIVTSTDLVRLIAERRL